MRVPMLALVILSSMTLFGSGCAAIAAHREAMAQKAASEGVCESEAPTGSHIRRRVCRSQSQIDADTRDSQAAMQSLSHSGSQSTGAISTSPGR